MVPSKEPCTESRRSRLARLTRSFSAPLRTTIARRRSPCPPPAFSISNRARSRPIRPKPYNTTSVLLRSSAPRRPTTPASSARRNSSKDRPPPSDLNFSFNRAISIAAAPSSSPARTSNNGAVSSKGSSSLLIRRAKRCAFKIPIVDVLTKLRPWMLVTTLFSRYNRPITGIMASANASRPIHKRREAEVSSIGLPFRIMLVCLSSGP